MAGVRSPRAAVDEPEPLVSVEGLVKHFPVRRGLGRAGRVHAVDGVDLRIRPGETLGVVGESGCGKSTLARCVAGLHPVTRGRVMFEGTDVTRLSKAGLKEFRRSVQMIFQDPYGALNPRRRVGAAIGDPLAIHAVAHGAERRRRVRELMELVGLNPEHYDRFPAEFSSGQRQRIGVARALALRPRLIVCDEPVSSLDVSIQAQVINLLRDLQAEMGLTYLFIAHDLSVVRHVSDRVAVMYLGRIVETAPRRDLYERPRHPYSAALLSAASVTAPEDPGRPGPAGPGRAEADRARRGRASRRLLIGDVPSPVDPPRGCRFHPRCPRARERCAGEEPPPPLSDPQAPEHVTACHFPLESPAEAPGGRSEAPR
ncbi:ABC transporter ATP-binding protein [Actinomadura sp. 9N407]|uniref:ABC transporter ATP-binding protein n=1 Tax=Actinomadura sp. 9N407 TaxID=3375154 RepID=UPI0037AF4F0D